MQLGIITQTQVSAAYALDSGLLDGWGHNATAKEKPDTPVYLYWNGPLMIGMVWGEQAQFETLVEFQTNADDEMATMWHDLQREMGWWLEDQELARL